MSGSSSKFKRSRSTAANAGRAHAGRELAPRKLIALGAFAAIALIALLAFAPVPAAQAGHFRLSITIHTRADEGAAGALNSANQAAAPSAASGEQAQTAVPKTPPPAPKSPAEAKPKSEVLKIVAGRDTINLGEKAVPLGGVKEKPEVTEDESQGAQGSRHRGLDFEVEKRHPNDVKITIGGDRNYGDGKDIVKLGEDIIVAEPDTVDGDVVSIGGSVTVNGVVMGDCVSIGGCINIGPRGVIEGDGVTIGGCINREPGSVLKGDEVVTGGNIPKWVFRGGWPQYGLSGLKVLGFAFAVGKALVLIFLAWLVVLIFRDRTKVVADRARGNLLAAFGVGLLTIVLTPIAMVLLCITLIGIPVAILLPIVIALIALFGYTAVGLAVGMKILGGESRGASVVKAAVLGVLVMEVIPIVGRIIGLPGGFMWGLSIPIRVIGYAIIMCAVIIGLGAAIMSKLGRAPKAPAAGPGGAGAPPIAGGSAPGVPAGTPGPVPQTPSVPGYGAPAGG